MGCGRGDEIWNWTTRGLGRCNLGTRLASRGKVSIFSRFQLPGRTTFEAHVPRDPPAAWRSGSNRVCDRGVGSQERGAAVDASAVVRRPIGLLILFGCLFGLAGLSSICRHCLVVACSLRRASHPARAQHARYQKVTVPSFIIPLR